MTTMWLEYCVSCLAVGVCICGNVACFTIRSYHKSKPMGLQTIFGRAVCILMIAHSINITFHGLVYIPCGILEFCENQDNLRRFLAVLSCIALLAMEVALLFALAIKYLSIYHSILVYALDEKNTIAFVKSAVIGIPLVLTHFEYAYLTDIETTVSFKGLLKNANGDGVKMETTKQASALLILCLASYLQYRLEYDRTQFEGILDKLKKMWQRPVQHENAQEWNVANNIEIDIEYKPIVLRVALAIFVLIVGLVMYQSLVGLGSLNAAFFAIYTVTCGILPTMFIWSHGSIRHHFLFKIRMHEF